MKLAQWRFAILEGLAHAESTHASGLGLVDIDAMQANNAAGYSDIIGWMYVMGDGTLYVQENANFKSFWDQIAKSVPAVGSVLSALDAGGIIPMNSSQWNTLMNYMHGHNGKAGSCFTSKLG